MNKTLHIDTVSTNKLLCVETVSTNKILCVDTVSTNKAKPKINFYAKLKCMY